jgi:hypothetical protein
MDGTPSGCIAVNSSSEGSAVSPLSKCDVGGHVAPARTQRRSAAHYRVAVVCIALAGATAREIPRAAAERPDVAAFRAWLLSEAKAARSAS